MATGIGGDELLAPPAASTPELVTEPWHAVRAAEHIPWLGPQARAALGELDANLAPVPRLPLPALTSFALHNPTYLQAGIWPVAPLTDHQLVRYAEQLPLHWRRAKAMLRQRLHKAGLPRHVTRPERPETFAPLMQLGLRRHGLPLAERMLRESLLIDTGYVDHRRFAAVCHAAASAPTLPSMLCDTIALELGLRSFTSQPLLRPARDTSPR